MKDMTKVEARKSLMSKSQEVTRLIGEMETLADQHNLGFDSPVDEYGMGGWYEDGEWSSSSSQC